MDDNTPIIVEDGENWSGNKDLNEKSIVLEQYRRCLVEGSKEMRPATTSTLFYQGKAVPVSLPDQRQVFINSVEMLCAALITMVLANEDIKTEIETIDGNIVKLCDTARKQKESWIQKANLMTVKRLDDKKVVPLVGNIEDEVVLQLLDIYRTKLMVLSMLLSKMKFFGEGGMNN